MEFHIYKSSRTLSHAQKKKAPAATLSELESNSFLSLYMYYIAYYYYMFYNVTLQKNAADL